MQAPVSLFLYNLSVVLIVVHMPELYPIIWTRQIDMKLHHESRISKRVTIILTFFFHAIISLKIYKRPIKVWG